MVPFNSNRFAGNFRSIPRNFALIPRTLADSAHNTDCIPRNRACIARTSDRTPCNSVYPARNFAGITQKLVCIGRAITLIPRNLAQVVKNIA